MGFQQLGLYLGRPSPVIGTLGNDDDDGDGSENVAKKMKLNQT